MIETFFTKVSDISINCFLGFDFQNVVLKIDRTNWWKSDNPVKTVFVFKKIFGLLDKIKSMQFGFSKFL